MLLDVLAIAYCVAYRMGEIVIELKPPTLKNHGYKQKSIVRYELDFLFRLISVCLKIHRSPFISLSRIL